jgi:ankyrin repeat protein
VATSLGDAPPLSAREQGQIELRNLQTELAAAKARGDTKSQEEAIQKSIEVIWRTQLAPPTDPSPTKSKSLSPKLKPRASSIRFPSFTSSSKGEALGNAAATGDDRTLSKLLMEKVNVNSTSYDFKTPMMRAAMGGHVHCLEILKTFGADEFAADKAGATALHYAVLSNNIPAAKWFLDTYPPPPTPDPAKNRSSILLRATDAAKWSRSLKNLREASDTGGSKPLHIAVECDMDDMVQTLLAAGVDIEAKNNRGRTPLHQAVIYKRYDPFKTLLRSGADAAAIDASRMSALHWAAKLGQISMIEELLDKGAARWEYDSTDSGYFPIHQAAREGQFAAIDALVPESEDLERRTKSGETLLHIASLYGHVHVVQYLLNRSVDVNPWAERSTCWKSVPRSKLMGSTLTPLHYTCCMGYFETAILLLDHGALVNAPSPDGYTALMMAVEADDTNLVSLLYNRGAKINASLPGTLTTALHMAARKGNVETVQQLCRAGADYKARAGKDSYKRTPAEEADHACSDKDKRKAVREYFDIIRQNEWAKRSAQIMVAEQPVTYAPWGPNTQQGGYLVHQAQNAPNPYQPQSSPPPPYTKAPPAWG